MVRGVCVQKRLLLPAILTVAMLISALSVRELYVYRSGPPKPRPRAVIESQINTVEAQIVKAFQAAYLCPLPRLAPPSVTHRLLFHQSIDTPSSVTVAAIPARGPPLP